MKIKLSARIILCLAIRVLVFPGHGFCTNTVDLNSATGDYVASVPLENTGEAADSPPASPNSVSLDYNVSPLATLIDGVSNIFKSEGWLELDPENLKATIITAKSHNAATNITSSMNSLAHISNFQNRGWTLSALDSSKMYPLTYKFSYSPDGQDDGLVDLYHDLLALGYEQVEYGYQTGPNEVYRSPRIEKLSDLTDLFPPSGKSTSPLLNVLGPAQKNPGGTSNPLPENNFDAPPISVVQPVNNGNSLPIVNVPKFEPTPEVLPMRMMITPAPVINFAPQKIETLPTLWVKLSKGEQQELAADLGYFVSILSKASSRDFKSVDFLKNLSEAIARLAKLAQKYAGREDVQKTIQAALNNILTQYANGLLATDPTGSKSDSDLFAELLKQDPSGQIDATMLANSQNLDQVLEAVMQILQRGAMDQKISPMQRAIYRDWHATIAKRARKIRIQRLHQVQADFHTTEKSVLSITEK